MVRWAVNGMAIHEFSPEEVQFVKDNEEWIAKQASANPGSDYWEQIRLLNVRVHAGALTQYTTLWPPCSRIALAVVSERGPGNGVQCDSTGDAAAAELWRDDYVMGQ